MTNIAVRSKALAEAASQCDDICPSSPKIVGIANALRMTRGQTVYVLSVPGGFYKVGITRTALSARISALQTGCPQRITAEGQTAVRDSGVDAAEMERGMHALLAPYRASGEWFQTAPEIVGRAWKETWVRLACPELYLRWQRFRLYVVSMGSKRLKAKTHASPSR